MVKQQVGSANFEKFLNCLINDMTYCLEEGLSKVQKIKTFESQQETDPGHITKEDSDNHN